MSAPVVLVFGAGPKIGLSALKKFKAEGYKTATITRSPSDAVKAVSDKVYAVDLTGPPEPLIDIFNSVRTELGDPTVIIYNGRHDIRG